MLFQEFSSASWEVSKKSTFWVPAVVVMGWVTGRNRSIQHKSGRRVDFLGTCFGGNGLGRREKPIDSAQVRAPIRVAFECTLDHGQRPAAPQAAEPNASRGSCKS